MTAGVSDMEDVLQPLIRSPQLPNYIRQLETALAEEQRNRQHFHETVQEGDKVEFINGEVVMSSPVRFEHNDASFALAMLIRGFADARGLGIVGHEKLMISPITEYWIVDAEHESVEQYLLEGDHYKLAVKTGDGTLKSEAISGFVIPARALFDPAERQRVLRDMPA